MSLVIVAEDVSVHRRIQSIATLWRLDTLQSSIAGSSRPLTLDEFVDQVSRTGAVVGRLADGRMHIGSGIRTVELTEDYGIVGSVTGQMRKDDALYALSELIRITRTPEREPLDYVRTSRDEFRWSPEAADSLIDEVTQSIREARRPPID